MASKMTARMSRARAAAIAAALAALGAGRAVPARSQEVSSSTEKTYEQLKVFVEAIDEVENNYVQKTDAKKLIYGALNGMMSTLDPFSQFMDPEESKEMKTETEGEFEGLGLRLTMDEDGLTVITPIPGTPAYKAGILPEDRIEAIDGKSTKDWTLSDAMKQLRGPPGSQVKLTVLRDTGTPGEARVPKDFTIDRAIVKVESVWSKIAAPGIGYLRITEFSARTPNETKEGMKKLVSQGAQTLILDLRNNPGGLLNAAVDVGGLFLPDGALIVYTRGRTDESREDYKVSGAPPYPDMPLIVLVNGGSASAAEIVAGALQDGHRAVVMGTRTYGKASVQSVIPLTDGAALRLTIAHYFTPSGRLIQRNEQTGAGGIAPDLAVSVSPETEEKIYRQWDEDELGAGKKSGAKSAEAPVSDPIFERAVELLKARRVLSALDRGN